MNTRTLKILSMVIVKPGNDQPSHEKVLNSKEILENCTSLVGSDSCMLEDPVIDNNSENFDPDAFTENEEPEPVATPDRITVEIRETNDKSSESESHLDFHESESEFNPSTDEESSSSAENVSDGATTSRNTKLLEERKNRKGRARKGRSTKYPGQTFQSRKKLKDLNQEHYTVKGRLKESKKFVDYNCNCPKKCHERLPVKTRESFFNKFWNLGSYNVQTGFIAATVKEHTLGRKRNANSHKRQFTRVYKMGNDVVCKQMYVKSYQLSSKRVDTALKKLRHNNLKDQRGQKAGGLNKLAEETFNKVCSQIKEIPTYISHYARGETEAKFLPSDYTLQKMFSMYLEDGNPKISFNAYEKIFYENFNLKRKPPIKDTCNTCDLLTVKIKNCEDPVAKEELSATHKEHLILADEVRNAMKCDFLKATKSKTLEVVSYDMQKVLGLPKIPTNIVYYKRQLSLFNEGVHSASTDTPYSFMWKEGIAGRGSQEVGSCLKKYIDEHLPPGTEELVLWSDSCGGQNRNIKITLLLKAVLSTHESLKTIYFKYLLPGHSFLPNDTDFGQIERALKYQLRVYTMEDFKKIVLSCKTKNSFRVQEMKTDDFLGVKEIENVIVNRKVDTLKAKINWLKARVVKIEKDEPFKIFLKNFHEGEDYQTIDISFSQRGRGRPSTNIGFMEKLNILWPNGKTISAKKLADIKFLTTLVPTDAKPYYKNLKPGDFDDDLDGFGEDIDFEIEDNL